ncbi:hypothetical protein VHEMI07738 [[Torrubiella] hemipterigena]|uniref:Uncharacterized protein n=1 Tax=[Torrubiella] hemipterigena TaxID=1531966 RepID=A0A0A1TLX4_9HYPO|nr:hypothetical protein VHEMI07738 [[Torrubiella] hemipterigena]
MEELSLMCATTLLKWNHNSTVPKPTKAANANEKRRVKINENQAIKFSFSYDQNEKYLLTIRVYGHTWRSK